MAINLIVAMTKDRVIGKPNALPWHISDDLKRFKRITNGQTVIMGRNTYESIGRPLPNRYNIVLSHESEDIEGVKVCNSLDEGLEVAKQTSREIFIIGGASVYKQALSKVDAMYVSHIKNDYEGTVFFPEYDESEWKEGDKEEYDEFVAITYKRVRHEQPT